MNILIKLTCLIGLVIAPILGEMYGTSSHGSAERIKPVIEEVVVAEEVMLEEVVTK